MLVSSAGVLVPLLTVLVGGVGMLLRLVMLAQVVMVRCLMVVMGCGVVVSGGAVMMLARWMRGFGHGVYSRLRAKTE